MRSDGYTREDALISVGPGWGSLITVIFDQIDYARRNTQYDFTGWGSIVIHTVKEKFGGLRIYTTGCTTCSNSRFVEGFIDAVEALSFHICENCGRPGELRTRRAWHQTLCDQCAGLPYEDLWPRSKTQKNRRESDSISRDDKAS